MIGWSRQQLADVAFAGVTLVIVYIRFQTLRAGGAPPTIDAGDWLAHGDAIFGSTIRSSTIVYPPLVPLLTKVFVAGFGFTNGISLIGAVAAAAPAVGIYLALRMVGVGIPAIGPALLVLGASSVGEAAAWGGFPQLIGFGLAPVVLVLSDRLLRSWSTRDALAAGVGFAVMMATSHFITSTVALGAVALVVFRLPERNPPSRQQLIRCVGAAILPWIWLIPLYITLLDAFGGASRQFRFFNELTWPGLWDQIEFLYRDLAWLWRPLMVAAVVAPFVLVGQRATALWRLAAALLLAIVAVLIVTREGRFVYFLTPYAGLGISLWVVHGPQRLASLRHAWTKAGLTATFVIGLLLVATVQIGVGADFFRDQRGYYGLLTPDLLEGIETVRDQTEPDTVLAVTSLNGAPFGRWVEAIADREVYYGSPLRWLLFEVDLERSAFANDLFIPPFPDVEQIRQAADAGIDLVLVPTRWVFYDKAATDAFAASYPKAVEHVTTELVVIDTAAIP